MSAGNGKRENEMTATITTAEDKVRDAYARIGGKPGTFSKLSDLRYALAAKGLTFARQDDLLRAMYRAQAVNLIPQSNQQALTADQRATALECGGEAKHLISIR
jgi:hypothetical protein